MDKRDETIKYTIFAILVTVFCCGACAVWVFNPYSILDYLIKPKKCTLPPNGFSDSDLAGTWVARRLNDTDTLILREDGKYKQIIDSKDLSIEYESDWLPWRVEYSEDDIPYLHLEGMRLCVALGSTDCNQMGWGNIKWHDMCQDKWVDSPNEGVLAVLGVPKRFTQPPRGIQLMLFISTENAWGYELQEP